MAWTQTDSEYVYVFFGHLLMTILKNLTTDDRKFSLLCSSTGDLTSVLSHVPGSEIVANTKIKREAETGERTFPKSRALIFASFHQRVIPQYYLRAWNRLVFCARLFKGDKAFWIN